VVFVMRSPGLLNVLYLRWLVNRLRLPAVRAVAGFRGLFAWLARSRHSRRALRQALLDRRSALVFLGEPAAGDAFTTLVSLQRRLDQPIFLVPTLLVWSRRPQTLRRQVFWDLLFGSPEAPSAFATAVAFLRYRGRTFVRAGRPIDLASFLRESAGQRDPVVARKVRGALHQHLSHQTRAIVGPPLRRASRDRERVLRDRSLKAALALAAAETGRQPASLRAEAVRDLREIASRYSPAFIEVARAILRRVFDRLYEGIEVDQAGLAAVKRAAADAPVVFCPSHKSHVDYVILPYVLFEAGVQPPHVAAGINLAFWPFGWIARHAGAFFIRRSFKGDKIYSATLRAYVKHLLRDGFAQEFYPEGGRSRSGKILSPKTGLFSMEVDAWLEGASRDVFFVPIAIDYERLVEVRSHADELAGGEKRKETFGALLKLPRLLLRRYGRIYLQFGEPISLRELADRRLGGEASGLQADDVSEPLAGHSGPTTTAVDPKRQLVQHLANRVAWGISQVTTVTPVHLLATALLTRSDWGLSQPQLEHRLALLRGIVTEVGGRFAPELAATSDDLRDDPRDDPRRPGPLADGLGRLVRDGLVVVERARDGLAYRVPDDRRPILDYYRNGLAGRYAATALVAAALRGAGADAAVPAVRAEAQWLSRLLKLEFVFQVGVGPEQVFDENVQILTKLGLVDRDDDRLPDGGKRLRVTGGGERLWFLADLVRPFLESYRTLLTVALADARGETASGSNRPELIRQALEHGRTSLASGEVRLRESISKVTFGNALEWLALQGALLESQDGRLQLEPSWRAERLPALIRELDRHLAS
jgi:glycerol-3-phosphate O-acyltransferase